MKTRAHIIVLLISLALAGNAYSLPKWFHGKSKKHLKQDSATVAVDSGLAGCKVDIDGTEAGVTGGRGALSVKGVDPGDHYLHVQCPQHPDTSYFISPSAGQKMQVNAHAAAATTTRPSENSPLAAAAAATQLRRMVSQAVQLRAGGQFEEAVELLRQASRLDPRNGDLHRELGITFQMFHSWERARVEMLEAVRLEPDSVEAHSGLAYSLEKLGNLNQALRQYQICTRLDPHDTSYRDHYVEVLGMIYAEKAQKKH